MLLIEGSFHKEIAITPSNYIISGDTHNKWLSIYKKADKIHLQSDIKDVRDLFLRDIDISEEQFLFFEPILRDIGGLNEKSGEVVRKILAHAVDTPDSYNRILEFRGFYIPIVVSAGNDAFGLIDLLRMKIETEPENILLNDFMTQIDRYLAGSINIIYGKYFSPRKEAGNEIDITEALKRIVEIEKNIHFKVDNGIVNGNDPDVGNQKMLSVKYSYGDVVHEKTFEEHKWLKLP